MASRGVHERHMDGSVCAEKLRRRGSAADDAAGVEVMAPEFSCS